MADVQRAQTSANGDLDCFCEIPQTAGSDLRDCEENVVSNSNGWCYADAAQNPAAEAVVANCPAGDQRQIRFVGNGVPQPGASLFISCQ
jgi:hypothetical protein